MAGKSVGSLNAMLSLSTTAWDAGLSKARKNLEKTRAQIIKSMNISGEAFSSKQAEMYAAFGGGGMGGVRASRELAMRKARESYMGKGTAEQNSWQQSISGPSKEAAGNMSGMMGTALKMGGVLMGVKTVLQSTVALTLAMEGGWKGAAEAARKLPIIGETLIGPMMDFVKAWKAVDVKEKYDEIAKSDAKMRADLTKRQRDTAKSMRDEAGRMSARNAIGGMEGLDKDLAEIELARKEAIAEVTAKYDDFQGLKTRDMAKARDEMIAQINAKASIDTTIAQRDDWRKQSEELAKQRKEQAETEAEWAKKAADVEGQIRVRSLRNAGRDREAETMEIANSWADRIDEARKAGREEVAQRMETLRDMEMAEKDKRGRRLAEIDFSTMAGTGSVEQTRDVLESIDRGIKRGVVARAA